MNSSKTTTTTPTTTTRLREGYDALERGDLTTANRCCREVLAVEPERVGAHFLVGLTALQARERTIAYQAFATVTRLVPTHAAAWAQLARLWLGEGQMVKAGSALARAVEHETGDPLIHDLIGTLYSLLGEHATARLWFDKAVNARPQVVSFRQNLANNQVYFGETGEAESGFRAILSLDPAHAQAHWALATVRRATDTDHVQQMREQMHDLARRGRLHPRARAFFSYAIGKELEDLEAWPDAFDAFAEGAAARRQTVEYDEAAEVGLFDFLAERFDSSWLERSRHLDRFPDFPVPVFIVGQPRTGTTLIERILAAHPAVHAAGELQQLHLAMRQLSGHREPGRFSRELADRAAGLDMRSLGASYLDTTRRMHGTRPCFIDKLPQNYLHLPLILAALPQARVIHVTREPLDACMASFKQLFADAYLHSYDQGEMARHHVRYRRLMDVWRRRFGDRFIEVGYESTVGNVEATARILLSHLGLPWDDACVSFHRSGGAVATASAVQVREAAHARSVGRWRHYADQLLPMRTILTQAGLVDAP